MTALEHAAIARQEDRSVAFLYGMPIAGELPANPGDRLDLVESFAWPGGTIGGVSFRKNEPVVVYGWNVEAEFWIYRRDREVELSIFGIWEPATEGKYAGPPAEWDPPHDDPTELVFIELAGRPWTGYLTPDEVEDMHLKIKAAGILEHRGIAIDEADDEAAAGDEPSQLN